MPNTKTRIPQCFGTGSTRIKTNLRESKRKKIMSTPQVYFIGAGPGAPDLITLRGQQIIARADCILYADSLVMAEIAQWAKAGAIVIPTAELNHAQVIAEMAAMVARGGIVARVHSGDPALYGAIHEQMVALDARGIAYEIVPGVSAVFAGAAALAMELTIAGLTQTVICTRVSGRASQVPERESLRSLAAHGASLAIFLSITKARQVQEDLLTGYAPDTQVAILYRISWHDEQIARCTLATLAETVRAAGFTRQALIIISPALSAPDEAASKLYAADFKHRFRVREVGVKRQAARPPMFPQTSEVSDKLALISITRAGTELARRLVEPMQAIHYVPQKFAREHEIAYTDSVMDVARRLWAQHRAIIFIAPVSIAVRAVGPLAQDKHSDPAIVALDEQGKFVVSVLSGHVGGANELARVIAALTNGQAVVTTASDTQELAALDLIAQEAGWVCEAGSALTRVMGALVNGEMVQVYVEAGCDDSPLRRADLPGLEWVDDFEKLNGAPAIVLSDRIALALDRAASVVFHPSSLALGIGCRKGVACETIERAARGALTEAGLSFDSINCLATVRLKAEEPGLLGFAEKFNLPLRIYDEDEINALAARVTLSPSAAQEKFDLPGVSEPCALLAANATTLLATKHAEDGVTVAVARASKQ